jgi:hypothetical protein
MATSPSEERVPPEVVAIAVALAATLFEPAADDQAPAGPDMAPWRWQGWEQ